MQANERIYQNDLEEILKAVGIEKENGKWWCSKSKTHVEVSLSGNKLRDVLEVVTNHFYNMGYEYGKKSGRMEKQNEIKKALDIL